jgi:hypothetical protein
VAGSLRVVLSNGYRQLKVHTQMIANFYFKPRSFDYGVFSFYNSKNNGFPSRQP